MFKIFSTFFILVKLFILVVKAELESATPALSGQCSNQLSYLTI